MFKLLPDLAAEVKASIKGDAVGVTIRGNWVVDTLLEPQ